MANGTKYNTKEELLTEGIQALVYENDDNETTSDNIQKAAKNIVESLWDGANPTATSKTAYVNAEFGNDTTGIVGIPSKKFKTITAANASTATTIIVEEGTYVENNIFKESNIYYLNKNVNITCSGSINQLNFNGSVFGYGKFTQTVNQSLFQNVNICYIEFESITTFDSAPLFNNSSSIGVIKLKGNVSSFNYSNKAVCTLGYEGIFGYPVTGNNISIYSENILFTSSINSMCICPFNMANLEFRFFNCVLKADINGSIFGRFSGSATGIKFIANNCYFIAGGTTASEDSIGAYQYTYIDNNTYSNKALHANTQAFQGTVIVDTDIVNLF